MSLSVRPRAIAFDCYGTLLDVTDESFIRACEGILAQHAIEHDSREFWKVWLAASRALSVEAGRDPEQPLAGPEPPFGAFRERWPRTFARAFADVGVNVDTLAAYQAFHNTLSAAVAYPDTRPALERLRGQFRLAVVSNADDDHLHHALAENGLEFEFILSSEAARSYKPRPSIFRQAVERFGLAPHEVFYVGDSPLMDVLGARNAGLPVAWLNRYEATRPEQAPPPDIEVRDLQEMADFLLALPVG